MKRSSSARPKTNHNPGWKARRQAIRRAVAEERQKKYDALPMVEKIRRAGKKVLRKLQNEETT